MDVTMDSWLRKKVAVVTGGGSGIGAATVRALSAHGAETVVMDIASGEAEPERFIRADVSQPADVDKAKDEVMKRYGRVDILVNSAGVSGRSAFVDMTVEEWQRVVQVNLFGTFLCGRAFARVMLPQRSGIIINVASDRGVYGSDRAAHYAASKGGIITLTKSMAKELRSHGIRVYAVNPGATRTPLWERLHTEEEKKKALADGKVIADPKEIAGMILLLTRPESACLVGLALSRDQLKG
ncbi:MAG: SDR family NAD(P)-dependent oxidoreductase [Thermodesulfobacteriota bacterium]